MGVPTAKHLLFIILILGCLTLATSGCDEPGCGPDVTITMVLVNEPAFPDGNYRIEVVSPVDPMFACREFALQDGGVTGTGFSDCGQKQVTIRMTQVAGEPTMKLYIDGWHPNPAKIAAYHQGYLFAEEEFELVYEDFYPSGPDGVKCRRASEEVVMEVNL